MYVLFGAPSLLHVYPKAIPLERELGKLDCAICGHVELYCKIAIFIVYRHKSVAKTVKKKKVKRLEKNYVNTEPFAQMNM